ncbi:hypothetical protein PSTG_05152 [Puccinia striiformis f. sp. tritici PST-78]|nr:hypothetical protein PSTG_05152 [Puccinia striiformis f. sp. tritici PST-78]
MTQFARGRRTNDQHNTELIRVDGLEKHLTGRLFVMMHRVFEESDELIQQLGLSKKQSNHWIEVASIRKRVVLHSSSAQGEVKRTIKWFTGTQLDRIQHLWPSELLRIDQILHDSLMRTQASTNRKFSEWTINRKRLASSFTRMNSEQLNRSASAPGDFAKTLGQIQHILANDTTLQSSSYFLIARIRSLKIRLGTAYCLIVDYSVPIIPETDGLPTQSHFNAWVNDWDTAYKLTIQNLLKTIEIAFRHRLPHKIDSVENESTTGE